MMSSLLFCEEIPLVAASLSKQVNTGEEFGLSCELAAMQLKVSLEFREDRMLVNMIR